LASEFLEARIDVAAHGAVRLLTLTLIKTYRSPNRLPLGSLFSDRIEGAGFTHRQELEPQARCAAAEREQFNRT
jgi:hypothetical protein